MNEVDGYEVVYRTDVAARLQRGYFGKPEGATARVYELVLSNPTAFESKQANKIRVRVDAWGNQDPFAASSRVFAEVVASQLVRSVYKKGGQIQEDLVEFHRHPLSLGDGDGPLPVGLIIQVMGKDGVSPQAASEVQQMLSDDAYCYPYLRALSIMGALFLVQLNSPALHGAIRQREELEEALLQEQQALAMASKSAGLGRGPTSLLVTLAKVGAEEIESPLVNLLRNRPLTSMQELEEAVLEQFEGVSGAVQADASQAIVRVEAYRAGSWALVHRTKLALLSGDARIRCIVAT